MIIHFNFDGHEVEMDYVYKKGKPAPKPVDERSFLTPPTPDEFEIRYVKVDGEPKEVNIDYDYVLDQMVFDEAEVIENILREIIVGEC